MTPRAESRDLFRSRPKFYLFFTLQNLHKEGPRNGQLHHTREESRMKKILQGHMFRCENSTLECHAVSHIDPQEIAMQKYMGSKQMMELTQQTRIKRHDKNIFS